MCDVSALERDDVLGQFVRCDIDVVVTFSLDRDAADIDGFLRAVLYTAHAGDALVAEDYGFALVSDVVHRADLSALSAHDAVVVSLHRQTLGTRDLRPERMLYLVRNSLGQFLLSNYHILNIVGNSLSEVL